MNEAHHRDGGSSRLLQLVPVLDLLLKERSVTRAAGALGVTQSAVSHALAELRRISGDQLLVRVGNRMELTPRATAMAPLLRQALRTLERAFSENPGFNAQSTDRLFRLGASDAGALVLLPLIVRAAQTAAPRARFEVVPLHSVNATNALEHGDLDLVVTVHVPESPGLMQSRLFEERLMCLLAADNAALEKPFDLEAYLALDHVVITLGRNSPSPVDSYLASLGRQRRIAVRAGYFLLPPLLLERSALVATLPEQAARRMMQGSRLALHPLPLPVGGGVVSMVWHERYRDEPGAKWLRKLVRQCSSSLNSPTNEAAAVAPVPPP